MKKNFFKFLLLGALALSVGAGFVGCKDYDDDITNLQKEIDALELSLSQLKDELTGGGKLVKDITSTGNGSIVVTYSDGSAPVTVKVVEGGTVGNLSIGTDGYWYDGSTKLDYQVVPANPRVSADGFWEFATVGADGIVWTKTDRVATGAYIVDAGSQWELWVAAKGSDQLQKIAIPKGSAGMAKIDILGWTTGKDKNSDNVSMNALNKTPNYVVNYAWIENFFRDTNFTPSTTMGASPLANSWSAKSDVDVKNVLNTLGDDAERKGFIVQVSPANTDIAAMEFQLENSQNEALPVVLQPARLLTGLLTKAYASSSALYFIPMTYQDKSVTYEKKTSVAPANVDYATLFKLDALYTLVEKTTGFRSEYTPWTITANAVGSTESAVKNLAADGAVLNITANAPESGVNSYKVLTGTPYSVDFDVTTSLADPIANPTGLVVDYYVEVKDNNDYVRSQFGVAVDKKAGTFTVGRLPDDLTLATFKLTVYKLGVDGKIYVEDIVIYPVRKNLPELIYEADYELTDENTKAIGFTSGTPASDQLSKTVSMGLAPMFTMLSAESSGIAGMTMKERWQNITYGAKFWNLSAVKIDGKTVDGTDYTASSLVANGNSTPTLAEWKTMFHNSGSQIMFSKNATGTPAVNNVTGPLTPDGEGVMPAPGLYEAQYIIMKPAYAQGDGVTPLFEIGKVYELTFDFYDEKVAAPGTRQNYLSSAVVKFTPVLPPLNDLFKKEDAYWKDGVLNAYYKWPSTWANGWFYDNNQTDDATDAPFTPSGVGATFYNVLSTAALSPTHSNTTPYDGGFSRFGDALNTDKQWLDDGTTLKIKNPTTQKIGDDLVTDLVKIGTTAGNRSTISLLGQTPTPATKNAYDKVLNMSIVPGLYLGVYDYTDYDIYDAALAELDFDMKVMSALEKGGLKGTGAGGAISVAFATTEESYKISAKDIQGWNYNNETYSVFPTMLTKTGSVLYKYTYIKEVEFFIPAEAGTTYNFVNASDTPIASPTTAIDPTWPGDELIESYVAIKINNISNMQNVGLGVRVKDRFGRKFETVIDFTLTANE